MIPRDLSPANQVVRNTLAEVALLRLLRAQIAADPNGAAALVDGVQADLKAAVGEYIAVAKASRDPKIQRGGEALQVALDAMAKQVEGLKPKA